jgi:hypothetical protein
MKEVEGKSCSFANDENINYFPSMASDSYEYIERLKPVYEKTKDILFVLSQAARIDNNRLEDFITEINKDNALNYSSGKDYICLLISNAKALTRINDDLSDIERLPVGPERTLKVAEMEPLLKWFTNEYIKAERHYNNYKGSKKR